jgi:hypothetical protein
MTQTAQPVGEVVESSTPQFTVACYELYEAPPFGALVKAALPGRLPGPPNLGERESTGGGWVYAVVYDVSTGSEPPGANVTVRGRTDLHDEAIYRAYPDLPEVMRTRFMGLIVGFTDGGVVKQYLPPQPPNLHYSVYVCSADEVCAFTDQLGYLRTILTDLHVPADELAAASIRQAQACRPLDPAFALRAGRQLALLLKEEYDRLRAILSRIEA